ncbi:MAG: hypothetical protein DMG41_31390 [Acidobacteria bacterium]|nr:MAG: hypothetical protein AUH13_25910 [Acidobacteria bacterium 13_2_20CM_58_27]PYT83389.1 MAG: hypothetical protein DMG41_31390 [Acidobacteriota bacterium]
MFQRNMNEGQGDERQSVTLRDLLSVGFRQKRLMINTFLGIFSLVIVLAAILPRKYQSEMKILVRHERADNMVTPDREQPMQLRTDVSEAELQSEAELVKSRDLLTKVVETCHLQKAGDQSGSNADDEQTSRAVVKLERDLKVEPIKLTNLISVKYSSRDPQLAARVLNTLASLYLEKHLAMHRAPGEFDFFHQQAERYRKALADEEAKLTHFSKEQGVVSPALEKEISVRKLADMEGDLKTTRANIVETSQRIRKLEAQLGRLPSRETAQVRTSDNPQLMERMKTTLLDLELKRTDLLAKFEPTYRPVQQVEQQIAQTKAAIAAAEKAPLRDETTDRDPTYEALRAELAKSQTDLASLEARATATASLVRSYRAESQELDNKELLHQDMVRAAKADEDNYMLYLHKQEEARINDALDRQRISNVVVAEPAVVPLLPQPRWLLALLLGGLVAALSSVVVAFAVDYWDPSLRTPEEVESLFGSPVVAAIPRDGE